MDIGHGLRVGATIAALLLAGCSANDKSIYRHKDLGHGSSITLIDAKQRAILASPDAKATPGSPEDNRRFCAEASPDVFAVIAQSLSVGGTFGQQADPKAIQAALNAALSSSEQASTIPRTQTITMLRELMYRTCERYLNGGISRLELPLQAMRDQRLMVSILAIEQLTGAVASKAVVLAAAAEAAAGASTAGGMALLDKARSEDKAASAEVAAIEKKRKAVEVKVDGKPVEACTKLDATKPEDEAALPQEVLDKKQECSELKAALKKAKDDQAAARAHYETQSKQADAGAIPVSSSAKTGATPANSALDKVAGVGGDDVASTVRDIVRFNFDQDEFLFLCLKLSDPAGSQGVDSTIASDVRTSCKAYFQALINAKAEKQNEEAALSKARALAVDKESVAIQATLDSAFEEFWGAISKDANTADPDKVKRLRGDGSAWSTCFDRANDKKGYAECFTKLRGPVRKQLMSKVRSS